MVNCLDRNVFNCNPKFLLWRFFRCDNVPGQRQVLDELLKSLHEGHQITCVTSEPKYRSVHIHIFAKRPSTKFYIHPFSDPRHTCRKRTDLQLRYHAHFRRLSQRALQTLSISKINQKLPTTKTTWLRWFGEIIGVYLFSESVLDSAPRLKMYEEAACNSTHS